MKTYAHVDSYGCIVGLGMIYLESGGYADQYLSELVKEIGEDEAIYNYGQSVNRLGVTTIVVDTADIPGGDGGKTFDKTFVGAFMAGANKGIEVDMTEAIEITHNRRRVKRDKELAPLDILATIPEQASAAEEARASVRLKYDNIQIAIDTCETPEELKNIISTEGI